MIKAVAQSTPLFVVLRSRRGRPHFHCVLHALKIWLFSRANRLAWVRRILRHDPPPPFGMAISEGNGGALIMALSWLVPPRGGEIRHAHRIAELSVQQRVGAFVDEHE